MKRQLEIAAKQNDSAGQFYLGKVYEASSDYEVAVRWYEQAAEKLYSPAIYSLGRLYELGRGVNCDKEKAYSLFERAAQLGHIFALKAYATRMMKYRRGLFGFIKGCFLVIKAYFLAYKLALVDQHSDRLRI